MSIRTLREALGISVTDLARRISEQGRKVHPDTIRNVELGHRPASRELMTAWARALDLLPLDVEQVKSAPDTTAELQQAS